MSRTVYQSAYRHTHADRRILNNRRRRIQELHKNISLVILTACLVLTLAISLSSFLSRANSGQEAVAYKYYTSIQVQSGDTLWSIALDNMHEEFRDAEAYVNEVMYMNGLQDENICAGQYLIIPYYSTEFIS